MRNYLARYNKEKQYAMSKCISRYIYLLYTLYFLACLKGVLSEENNDPQVQLSNI